MAVISQAPAPLDLVAVKGDDLTVTLTVTENSVAYDWTGATVATSIIDSSGTEVVTDFTVSTPTNGTLQLALTDTNTTTLGVGNWRWQVNVTKASATRTWLAGVLSVMQSGWAGTSTSSASLSITTGAVTVAITSVTGGTAAGINVVDSADYFNGTNVESVLSEIAPRVTKSIHGVSCVLIGDSITAQNDASTSVVRGSSNLGYFNWANIALRGQLSAIANLGVSGYTSAQVLSTVDTAIAYNPDWVFVLAGTNDFNAGGLSASAVDANLLSIINKIRRANIAVCILTHTPVTGLSTAQQQQLNTSCAWIKNVAAKIPGVVVADVYSSLAAPLTGEWKTGTNTDTQHPNAKGASIMGQVVANALRNFVPAFDVLPGSNLYQPMGFNTYPMLTGTGGTVSFGTGTVASNWVGTRVDATALTATWSKVTRTDQIAGEWQQVAITSGNPMLSLNAVPTSGFSVGDPVFLACEYQADTGFGGSSAYLAAVLTFVGSSGPFQAIGNSGNQFVLDSTSLVTSGVIRTPTVNIPSGTTQLSVQIQVAGATGTIRFARPCIIRANG